VDQGSLFTNRVRAKGQFVAALTNPQGADTYRVLNWFGVGGQGKTALLEEFERIMRQRNEDARTNGTPVVGFALIDFENPNSRAIENAMLSICDKLRQTAGVHCPTLEAALLRYLALARPGVSIKDLKAQFFHTGSEVLDNIMQALEVAAQVGGSITPIPGFGLLSKWGSKAVSRAGHAFHTWWTRRGVRAFAEIDALSQDALLRKLPSYLGADLMDAMANANAPRIVILLDTYEALWRGQALRDGPGALRIDDWVRLLVQDARGAMFVVAGRDALRWGEVDGGWREIIERRVLGGLTRLDAAALLEKHQVNGPAIVDRMIAGARSQEFAETDAVDPAAEAYLPYYLVLQAETYHDIRSAGRSPLPDDFGGEHPKILARFLEHLDPETDRLLRVASYPWAIEDPILDLLADEFLFGRANVVWSGLLARSVVSEERQGIRLLHDLLRHALQERERVERPELYAAIHGALFRWFSAQCDEVDPRALNTAHERSFLAALRHLGKVDEREAVRWSNGHMERFDDAARWRALEEACLMVLPTASRAFGDEDPWTTANLLWLASAYRRTGRYAEAEKLYEQVLAIDEKTLGTEHPSFAETLHALAGVYSDTGRYAEAERLYEQVRAIEEKTFGIEHPSFAATLRELAGVYGDTGRYAEAEKLYEQVRAIEEKSLGTEHPSFVVTLHALAGVYRNTGRYAEAERLYEQVRAIEEKTLGTEHPSFAATLRALAGVYSDTGRYAEAEKLYEQVRAIEEKTLGTEHPWFATRFTHWPASTATPAATPRPRSCTGRCGRSTKRRSASSTPGSPRRFTHWPACTATPATTPRPRSCTSRCGRSTKRRSGPSTPRSPRRSRTWLSSAATPAGSPEPETWLNKHIAFTQQPSPHDIREWRDCSSRALPCAKGLRVSTKRALTCGRRLRCSTKRACWRASAGRVKPASG